MHTAVHGQGQREVGERVESYRGVTTLFAGHVRLELAVEEVHDYGTVAL